MLISMAHAYLESDPSQPMHEWLAAQNYNLQEIEGDMSTNKLNPYFGGIQAEAFENGRWVGAADPRRDGVASTETTK